jgi:hypothetical protein
MCPNLPEVRQNLVDRVTELCQIDGIEGICLDYCRLVDVVLPVSLSYIYNITQDGEVFPQWDFGYHPAMLEEFMAKHGYDPREQEDPSKTLYGASSVAIRLQSVQTLWQRQRINMAES